MFQEIFNKHSKNENHGVYKLEKTPALCLISVINCSKNPSKKLFIKKINWFFWQINLQKSFLVEDLQKLPTAIILVKTCMGMPR